MSDEMLAAAAAALGAPPELVMRSAQARASADGVPVEDVLAAWAGGAPPPTRAPVPEEEAAPPAEEPVSEEEAPAPAPAAAEAPAAGAPEAPPPVPVPGAVFAPPPARRPSIWELPAPLLAGRRDSNSRLLFGIAALFLAGMLGSVVLPALAVTSSGALMVRSELAEAGRSVYVREGCWYCHTQLVRPIVTDVGLGPVTQAADLGAELPSTVGQARLGPDLAHVGSRPVAEDAAALEAYLMGAGDSRHQSYRYLSPADLAALVAYLQSLE